MRKVFYLLQLIFVSLLYFIVWMVITAWRKIVDLFNKEDKM